MALTMVLAFSAASLEALQSGGTGLRGIPGSVTSARPDGSLRGIPGSVTDPSPGNEIGSRVPHRSRNSDRRNLHRHRFPAIVYPYYGYPYLYDDDDYANDDQQSQPPQQSQPTQKQVASSPEGDFHAPDRSSAAQAQSAVEPAPMTTLVFRDGHKAEVQNYAIIGDNLIDVTRSAVIKKIPLSPLDLDETRRVNEANGVDFPSI